MNKLPSYFNEFLKKINPSTSYLEDQRTGHLTLRKRLREDEEFKEHYLNCFLQGSYARKTAIHPGKDVDIVVVTKLDPDSTDVGKANAFLKRILEKYYPGKVMAQTRSFCVQLSYVSLDVVLATSKHLGSEDYTKLSKADSMQESKIDWKNYELFIPDRDLKEWVKTNPKKQMEATTELNEKCDGNFVPLIKIVKWWRSITYAQPKYPKGYIIERIVADNITPLADSYPENIRDVFGNIVSNYKPLIAAQTIPDLPDPGNPTHNVASRLEFEHFNKFYEKAEHAFGLIESAYEEEDLQRCVDKWKKVLGDQFPTVLKKTEASFPNRPIIPNKPSGFA